MWQAHHSPDGAAPLALHQARTQRLHQAVSESCSHWLRGRSRAVCLWLQKPRALDTSLWLLCLLEPQFPRLRNEGGGICLQSGHQGQMKCGCEDVSGVSSALLLLPATHIEPRSPPSPKGRHLPRTSNHVSPPWAATVSSGLTQIVPWRRVCVT